ncbi:MAG: VOC family protein [Pseudomonadota bacterium]
MAYGPIVTTLKVASMQASLAFYTEVLDFQLKWRWSAQDQFEDAAEPDLACIECGEAVLFLSINEGSMAVT